ncbi:MAG: VRR-NUC domain-containing protein [Geminicoccaceae bacterium]
MQLESAPLHALFGVMMWQLIQDFTDPKIRIVGFGSRTDFEAGEEPSEILTQLPEDFGTPGYGARRTKGIEEHFGLMSFEGPSDRRELLDLFDYCHDPSVELREYLWAHRAVDVSRARRVIEIIPAEMTIAILRYLVDDYWGRYLGWPDLLLWRDEDFMMVEVKSSSDKLSTDQMRWIADNYNTLKVPFRVAKLHRKRSPRATT